MSMFDGFDDEFITESIDNLKNIPHIDETINYGILIDGAGHVFMAANYIITAYAMQLSPVIEAAQAGTLTEDEVIYYKGVKDILMNIAELNETILDMHTPIDDVIDQLLD